MPSEQKDIDGEPDTASEDGHGEYDGIIVGAGAAGIGVGIAIAHAGIESLLVLDRETLGTVSYTHLTLPTIYSV